MSLIHLRKKSSAALGLSALLATASSWADGTPIQLSKESLKIVLDPSYGGRITELRYGERDLLALPQPGGNNFGSTFWLSPQSLWNWPPVPEHDTAPYTVTARQTDAAAVTSASGAGARVSKTVNLSSGQRATVRYRIDTEKDFPEIAAWEITRLPNRGLAFAPVTRESVRTVRGQMDYRLQSDILWLSMEAGAPLMEGKVIANGTEGWLAYTVDQLLYVKVYPQVDASKMATGEGDIELYLSGERPYLELEVQSAAHSLKQGDALDWSVDWVVAPIPEGVNVHIGSPALLQFVRDQVSLVSAP
ncbi:DUF4380 domain-containing protein [Microbulbifer sp. Q7]|uniref:DUF4380 domain-containing protein n=1 Tax=Microbulbifer sp. Q7 TaxID=1785091 RepID=UPI00082D1D92|nr:DUF4380 domain-containing protein [Microbulbifer sp. Q7]